MRAFLGAMCACVLTAAVARGAVKPNPLFGDHMVLQAGVPVPVWGTASPGEAVTVTVGDQKRSAVADGDGKWMVRLAPLEAGGPFEMAVEGTNRVVLHDVLAGEVWLGSGQSNMQFPLAPSPTVKAYSGVTQWEREVAAADHPQVRFFTVKPDLATQPAGEVAGHWEVSTPATAGACSAVGYFFARDLQAKVQHPVGFINSSFGASTAEAWVSAAAMDGDPRLAGLMKGYQTALAAFDAHPTTAATAPAGRRAPRDPRRDQHSPSLLWNAMLRPLQPYAIRGVVWYQGESVLNGAAGDALYPAVMEALVTSWRRDWGQGDLPFYVTQLAGQEAASNNPAIREAQSAILSLPNTGVAITIDVGERKNVHPKNKQDVGDRLSRIALAKVYGQSIEYSGPVYDSMSIAGGTIRLKFTHADGLAARGGPLQAFTIAGPDGKFVPATATIDGDTIVVSEPTISAPANVRYAWANWPAGCNLYSAAGLPAAPFRTDRK